jgi:hypothetical protein
MLALVVVVAGCGKAAAPGASGPAVQPTCPAPGGTEAGGSAVPDGFVTAWVFRCRSDVRDLPGQGMWQVQVAERADTPATELIAELRKPSDPRTAEACTMELVVPPYFVLVDATGQLVQPAVPTDTCGKPRREALAALEKLTFRTLSETPVNQVRSPKSSQSGCSDSWKDMIAIELGSARPGPAKPESPKPTDPILVCIYGQISGDQVPVGQLVTGHTITGDPAAALYAELAKAGPPATCSTPHTRFAVLIAPPTGSWATVELDGCRRMLRTDNTLVQLDEGTITALTAS